MYPRAELQQVIHSAQFSSATVSESYWVLVKPGRGAQFIGKVQYFFTMRNTPDHSGFLGLFYAVVDAYETSDRTWKGQTCWQTFQDRLIADDRTVRGRRLIRLSDIKNKLMRFCDPLLDTDSHGHPWVFQTYSTTSLT